MVTLSQLLLPILLSAVLVFIASSLVHMVLKWHNKDYGRFPNEDEVRAAINRGTPAPGQYILPWCSDPSAMNEPGFKQKLEEGPIATVHLKRPGVPSMGPMLGQWFVFNLVVSIFVAYVASRTLPAGTAYLRVFQVVGSVTFMTYAGGQVPTSIWMGKPWAVTLKDVADALLYGLVSAGAFGWLWPR